MPFSAKNKKYLPVMQELTAEDQSNLRAFVDTPEYKTVLKVLDNRRGETMSELLANIQNHDRAQACALHMEMIDDLIDQLRNYAVPVEEPPLEEPPIRLATYQP